MSMTATTAAQTFLSTPSVRRATSPCPLPRRMRRKFLSTPSVRRATAPQPVVADFVQISIHALREEGDVMQNIPRTP